MAKKFMCVCLGILALVVVSLTACVPSSETEKTEGPRATDLRFDVVSTERLGEYVEVKVKITNVSGQHVNSANVTCVLLDRAGEEITFKTHYAVKSSEGGLAPRESTYFTYTMAADYSQVASVRFKVRSIR
jgi:hypothetical protein